MDPEELKWKPYIQTWIEHRFSVKLPDATKVRRRWRKRELFLFKFSIFFLNLIELFDKFIDPGLKFLKKHCIQTIDQVKY